jgi:hypothetical protein
MGSRRRSQPGRSRTPAPGEGPSAEPAASGAATRPTAGLERALQVVASIAAPITVLSALLFYFGWIRTNALFQHFGVDAAVLGFSTQDYVLRSVEALYVPLGTLLVAGLASLWAHGLVATLLATHRRLKALRRAAVVLGLVGLALFARGVAGVILPRLSRNDFLTTPLCLGLGAAIGAYSRWLSLRLQEILGRGRDATQPGESWSNAVNLVLVILLVVLSLFWAATNYAQAVGRGRAASFARGLAGRPGVVVYSVDRLFLQGPGILETTLPADPHASYHYRYSGLRLLTESRGRVFLLPEGWTPAGGSTIMLDDSNKVRVEFVPGLGT